jgi:hypothetical protein
MNKRLILTFLCGMTIQGCTTNQRAGDITLATPPTSSESLVSTTSNVVALSGSALTTDASNLAASSTILEADQASKLVQTDPAVVPNSSLPARTSSFIKTKPDCQGDDCPVIQVTMLRFSGHARFNAFLDQTMATMVQMDSNQVQPFNSLNEFADYFWQVAKPRDQVVVHASVKRGDENLVVVQIDSDISTSGPQSLSTTQYINWLPQTDRLLPLDAMLLPNKMAEFQNQLKKQYDAWLLQNPEAIANPTSYMKKWPFVPNDNAALMQEGLAVTYDPYSIAPYAFGRPTLLVPYQDLQGILRPELLPE